MLDEKYIKTYGEQYENSSLKSEHLWKVFKEECEKYNLLYDMKDIIKDYKSRYESSQITWF
ncbi:hypothetical protein ACQQ2T_09265 [Paraclostridium tenue]